MLKSFEEYGWDNLYQELNLKGDRNPKYFLAHAVRYFTDIFSPKQGFLGLKGRLKRSEEDVKELMVKMGLCEDKEEALNFINRFKNQRIDYLTICKGNHVGEWFKLSEFINQGEKKYLATSGSLVWE